MTEVEGQDGSGRNWTFLTNHAHVLLCVARDPRTRLRDVAECVGITERAAHRLVGELEAAGYVERRREGRRNVYEVRDHLPLEHPMERGHDARDVLGPLLHEIERSGDDRAA